MLTLPEWLEVCFHAADLHTIERAIEQVYSKYYIQVFNLRFKGQAPKYRQSFFENLALLETEFDAKQLQVGNLHRHSILAFMALCLTIGGMENGITFSKNVFEHIIKTK